MVTNYFNVAVRLSSSYPLYIVQCSNIWFIKLNICLILLNLYCLKCVMTKGNVSMQQKSNTTLQLFAIDMHNWVSIVQEPIYIYNWMAHTVSWFHANLYIRSTYRHWSKQCQSAFKHNSIGPCLTIVGQFIDFSVLINPKKSKVHTENRIELV